jgi:hypothetical protein
MDQGENLLRPTLGGAGATRSSIYSTTTGYLAAFFGGPVAAAVVALVNSRRLGRLSRDWPFAALAIGAQLAFIQWQLGDGPARGETPDATIQRLMQRLLGVAFFALAFLLHRRYFRNMDVAGIKAPSGWMLGAGAIVAGLAVNLAMRTWMAS